jgi:hypothetical protein
LARLEWQPRRLAPLVVAKRVRGIGGLFTSFFMELLVYPAVYLLWKWHTEVRRMAPLPTQEPALDHAAAES